MLIGHGPLDEETEWLIALLQTVKVHYDKTKDSTLSTIGGICDCWVSKDESSFGSRMLEVSGTIPERPFAVFFSQSRPLPMLNTHFIES